MTKITHPEVHQKCVCGHLKTDHKIRTNVGIRKRGECDQWSCNCKKFNQIKNKI